MTQLSLAEALEICTQKCLEMDGTVTERLRLMADDVRRLAPQFTDIVDRMVNRLQASEAGSTAPAVGEVMPPFVLADDNGRLVGLEQLLKNGKVVVAFHRGHWCPYCRINAAALAEIEVEVSAAGAQLVVIAPEKQKYARKLKLESGAKYPILSDLDNGYALELQLAIKIAEDKRSAMTQAGWDIAPYQDNDSWILPIPATFVIGQDGIVKARFVDPDYRKRMGIEDLLAAIRE